MSWQSEAQTLVDEMRDDLSATVTMEERGDRLTIFVLRARNDDATEIRLALSERELILSAGSGTRFELGPLPSSKGEALELARAVAAGDLTESIGRAVTRFDLQLADGSTRRGRTVRAAGLMRGRRRRTIRYAEYRHD